MVLYIKILVAILLTIIAGGTVIGIIMNLRDAWELAEVHRDIEKISKKKIDI
jgi:hypothetical protein